ncbi:MAG: hypothetical protein ACFFCI_13710 [Promethearchaeota archaeon]
MEKKHKNENLVEDQKFQSIPDLANNPKSYIEEKLDELSFISDELIHFAYWLGKRNPLSNDKLLKETKINLTQRIGHGSIGPAIAAAEPLLHKKLKKLQSFFGK